MFNLIKNLPQMIIKILSQNYKLNYQNTFCGARVITARTAFALHAVKPCLIPGILYNPPSLLGVISKCRTRRTPVCHWVSTKTKLNKKQPLLAIKFQEALNTKYIGNLSKLYDEKISSQYFYQGASLISSL